MYMIVSPCNPTLHKLSPFVPSRSACARISEVHLHKHSNTSPYKLPANSTCRSMIVHPPAQDSHGY